MNVWCSWCKAVRPMIDEHLVTLGKDGAFWTGLCTCCGAELGTIGVCETHMSCNSDGSYETLLSSNIDGSYATLLSCNSDGSADGIWDAIDVIGIALDIFDAQDHQNKGDMPFALPSPVGRVLDECRGDSSQVDAEHPDSLPIGLSVNR